MMTTQRPDADEQETLAQRVMNPDEVTPIDSGSRSEPETQADAEPETETHTELDGEPTTVDARDEHVDPDESDDPVDEPQPRTAEEATFGRPPEEPRAAGDLSDRTSTQVLPSSATSSVDDQPTHVVPAVDYTTEDPTATRPMPAVEPEAVRSTDRDAARARAEARFRPADDPYESLYAPTAGGADGGAVVPVAAAAPQAEPEPRVIRRIVRGRPTTDKFHGALALFVLRLVVAAITGAHGAQKLFDLNATRAFFAQTQLPYSDWFALATGIGEVLIACALIIGLLVRVAGLGLMLISVGALVFVLWAPFVVLRPDVAGFVGEKELLLAAVGLLFLLLGGGGWGVDRMFRSAKSKGQVEEDEA